MVFPVFALCSLVDGLVTICHIKSTDISEYISGRAENWYGVLTWNFDRCIAKKPRWINKSCTNLRKSQIWADIVWNSHWWNQSPMHSCRFKPYTSSDIFSRTNEPTSTKLGTNHNSWVRGSLFVQMPNKTLCYGEIIAKSQTTLTTWKMFTLELRGQFQPCLAQSILWWRYLILSNEGLSHFSRRDNNKDFILKKKHCTFSSRFPAHQLH